MSGRDADPILISLREAYVPSKQRDLKVSRRNVLSDSRPAVAPGSTRLGASTPAASTHSTAPSSSLAGAGVRALHCGVVWGSLVCGVPEPSAGPLWASGPYLAVGLGRAAALRPLIPHPHPPMSLQEAGKLEEVMQELRALRALVKEQGERIGRLEEQLGRMENGDA